MFVGHYGISFAGKRVAPAVSLTTLFIAVQLLDVGWSVLVLLGVEKVRIVPGITATNPLDLYYMPYTHSLLAALLWSAAAGLLYRIAARATGRSALVVGAAVFSHWVLDFLVHRPDLPLWDDRMKVGLGLWNFPAVALGLEAALLFGGLWLYFQKGVTRRTGFLVLAVVMLAVQVFVFYGSPPPSGQAAALTALAGYAAFAAAVALLERRS